TEHHVLPAAGGLVAKRPGGQQRAGAGPQRTGVGAGVGRALVEPDAGDVAVGGAGEPDTQLDRGGVAAVGLLRSGVAEQRARAAGVDRDLGRGGQVAAVVGGPSLDVPGAGAVRGAGVGPGRGAGGRVPGNAAVEGDLDTADHATTVVGAGAGHGDGRAVADRATGRRAVD